MRGVILICLAFLSISALYTSCSESDLGNETLTVELKVKAGTFGDGESQSKPNQEVRVAYCGEDEFLFTEVSDNDGLASFTNLNKDERYTISSSFESEGVTFEIEESFEGGRGSLSLEFMPVYSSFKALRLRCVDNLGAVLPNIPVCIYQSQILANNGDCSFASYTDSTNINGEITVMDIASGDYIAVIRSEIGAEMIDISQEFSTSDEGLTDIEIPVFQ